MGMSDGKLSVTRTALTLGRRITELESQVEQLRGLLKWLENIMGDLTDGNCRICGRDMYDGHASDCELARAIGGVEK